MLIAESMTLVELLIYSFIGTNMILSGLYLLKCGLKKRASQTITHQ